MSTQTVENNRVAHLLLDPHLSVGLKSSRSVKSHDEAVSFVWKDQAKGAGTLRRGLPKAEASTIEIVVLGLSEQRQAVEVINRQSWFGHDPDATFGVVSPKLYNNLEIRDLLHRKLASVLVEDIDKFTPADLKPFVQNYARLIRLGLESADASQQKAASDPLQLSVSLRDPNSGKLDAFKVADLLGLNQAEIAKVCGVSRQALNQTPDSKNIQQVLQSLEEVAEGLIWCGGDLAKFRAWLNRPNRDFPKLKDRVPAPLDLIRHGFADVVADKVHHLLHGIPG